MDVRNHDHVGVEEKQLPQVAESILRGDRILARLDEMILLLKELLKEMKRRERQALA
jgi:hypothetical protein